jgi:hypothetical protein
LNECKAVKTKLKEALAENVKGFLAVYENIVCYSDFRLSIVKEVIEYDMIFDILFYSENGIV